MPFENKRHILYISLILFLAGILSPACAEVFSKEFSSGWRVITPPCVVEGKDPATFLEFASATILGMDAGTIKPSYELTSMTSGKGYWAYMDETMTLDFDCPPYEETSVSIMLDEGWNIIGIPFDNARWAEATMDGLLVDASPKIASGLYQYAGNASETYRENGVISEWNGYAVKASSAGTLSIPALTENSPPVASAGEDFKWFVGSAYTENGTVGEGNERQIVYQRRDITATLDGRNSSDPDGDVLSYRWTQTGGPDVVLSNPYASMTTFVTAEETTYSFELEVSDGLLVATDSVSITAKKMKGKLAISKNNTSSRDILIHDLESMTGSGLVRVTDHDDGNEQMPRWSTDATKILYAENTLGGSEDAEIYLINVDGTGKMQITNNLSDEYAGDISGDGRIVYCSDKDGPGDLYDADLNGNDERRLTNLQKACARPVYSEDSSKIAFIADEGGGVYDLYSINSDGTGMNRLTNDSMNQISPSWTPEGKILYIESSLNTKLYAIYPDGSEKIELIRPEQLNIFFSPTMSEDGTFIYCISNNDLYVMYSDGSSYLNLGYGGLQGIDYHSGP